MLFPFLAILWTVALLAVSMTAWGLGGALAAAIVVGLWKITFGLRWPRLLNWILCLCLCVGFAYFNIVHFVLNPEISRGVECRESCNHNLLLVARALTISSEVRGTLPPATSTRADGVESQSWRVAVLPFLEYRPLFNEYRRDEPWNSQNNASIGRKQIDYFLTPCHSYNDQSSAPTTYYAVVGDRTAWPPDRGRPLSEITDDPSTTILLIECMGRNTPWSKPEDLSFDEAIELLTNPPEGAAPHEGRSLHVAFVDGSVRLLEVPIAKNAAAALLTVDGNEAIEEQDFQRRDAEAQLDPTLFVFLFLAVLPAILFVRRNSGHITKTSAHATDLLLWNSEDV